MVVLYAKVKLKETLAQLLFIYANITEWEWIQKGSQIC